MKRRSMLKGMGGAAGFMILPRRLIAGSGETPPSETVYFAGVGVGGQGQADLRAMLDAKLGKVVAFAEVDPARVESAKRFMPDAQVFEDYREMYERVGKSFDAVVVATPDHWHALPTLHAMQIGKHVYTEKPLTRTVWETRQLMKAARKHDKVVTQMGNQGHSFASHRVFTNWVRKGLLGEISEVHTWVTMGIPNAKVQIEELSRSEPPPVGFNWELWNGPAPERAYARAFIRGAWRGWTPYGTGSPGDWGCHLLDPIYDALDLRSPQRITAEVEPDWDPEKHALAFPNGSRIRYEFDLPGGKVLTILWHDGVFCNEVPRPPTLEEGRELGNKLGVNNWNAGAVVYGSKYALKYGSHGADGARVFPESEMRDLIKEVRDAEKDDPGFWHTQIRNNFDDFVGAIKEGRKSGNPFETAGYVSENASLGAIAVRNPGITLEWDMEELRFKNSAEANAMVEPHYRKGYELKV